MWISGDAQISGRPSFGGRDGRPFRSLTFLNGGVVVAVSIQTQLTNVSMLGKVDMSPFLCLNAKINQTFV
jgi:hypothetical protein